MKYETGEMLYRDSKKRKFFSWARVFKTVLFFLFILNLSGLYIQYETTQEVLRNQVILATASYNNSSAIINLTQFVLKGAKLMSPPTQQSLKAHTVYIVGEGTRLLHVPVLETVHEEKVSWLGTGVVVKMTGNTTYILTNAHVASLEGVSNQEIYIQEFNSRTKATLVAVHPGEDLALIKVMKDLDGKLPIKGTAYPEIGRKVYSLGHSLGRPYIYSEGLYAGTTLYHDIFQLPTMGGQSGSGVFNEEGMLIGLINSISGGITGWSITWDICHANAVKVIYIEQFLQEYLQ